MIQPPRRNLPPDAEPWGRWVEGLLLAQNQSGEANGQSINNTLRGVNASLQQLGNQIQALSAQQADILDLIDKQVIPVTFSQSIGSTLDVSGGTTTPLTVTLNAPLGMSRCIVVTNGYGRVFNSSGTGSSFYIWVYTTINGTDGLETVVTYPGAVSRTGISAQTALVVASTVTVQLKVYVPNAITSNSGNSASLNGIALWLR